MENKEIFYLNPQNQNLKRSNSCENIKIDNSRSNLKIKQDNFYGKNSTNKKSKHYSIDRNNFNPNLPQLVIPSNFLEEMYIKYSKSLQRYFLENREGMKLQGNKYFQNITIDQFIKERPNSQRKYLNILKNSKNTNFQDSLILNYSNLNKNEIGNKINGEDFFLTPLPNKSRKLLNTIKEKNDFLFAERAAVMMRTFEYTHGIRSNVGINELQKMMEEQKQKLINIMVDAVYKIQNWWKKIKEKKKRKERIKRNKENENFSQKMNEYQKVLNRKKIGIVINKLFNYCMKKTIKSKKYCFKKLFKFSQYQIKKIYYLYDWVSNIRICKGRRLEFLSNKINNNTIIFKKGNFERNYYFTKYKFSNKKDSPLSIDEQKKKIQILQNCIKKFLHYKKIKEVADKIKKESFNESIEHNAKDINFVKFLNSNNKNLKTIRCTKRENSFENNNDNDNDSIINYNEKKNLNNNQDFGLLDLNITDNQNKNNLNLIKGNNNNNNINNDNNIENNKNNNYKNDNDKNNNKKKLKCISTQNSEKKNSKNSKIKPQYTTMPLLFINQKKEIDISNNYNPEKTSNISPSKISKKIISTLNFNRIQNKEKNGNSLIPKSKVNKFVADVPKSGRDKRNSINKSLIFKKNSLNNNSITKNSMREDESKQNKTSYSSKGNEIKLIVYENENDKNNNEDKKFNNIYYKEEKKNFQNQLKRKDSKSKIKNSIDSEKIVNSIIENKKKELDEMKNISLNRELSHRSNSSLQINQMIQKFPSLNRNLSKDKLDTYNEKSNENLDNNLNEKKDELIKKNRNSSVKNIPHPHLNKSNNTKENINLKNLISENNKENLPSVESLIPGLLLYHSLFNSIQKPYPNNICYISKINKGNKILLTFKKIFDIIDRKIFKIKNEKFLLGKYLIIWKNNIQKSFKLKSLIIKYDYILSLKKSLIKWIKYVNNISKLVSLIVKLNKKKIVMKHLIHWKNKNNTILNFQKTIEKFLKKKNKNLLKDYLNIWYKIIILETQQPYIYSQTIRSISSEQNNHHSQHFSYYCKINKSNNENDYLTIRICLGYKLLLKIFSRGILHLFLIKLKNRRRGKKKAKTNIYTRRNTKVHLELLNMNLKLFHCLNSIIKKKFYFEFFHRLLYISLNINKNIEYNLETNNKCNLIREGFKRGYFQILNNILTIRFNYLYIDSNLKFEDFVKRILTNS